MIKPTMLYVLDGKVPVLAKTFRDAENLLRDGDARRVAFTHIDRVVVSTVFTVVPLMWDFPGNIKLFETAVFEDGERISVNASETWEEAEKTHTLMCDIYVPKKQV